MAAAPKPKIRTHYVIQPFGQPNRGQPSPRQAIAATTESGLLRRAEALAGRHHGVAALRIVADQDTGDVEEATVLETWGSVPEDLAEQIRGA